MQRCICCPSFDHSLAFDVYVISRNRNITIWLAVFSEDAKVLLRRAFHWTAFSTSGARIAATAIVRRSINFDPRQSERELRHECSACRTTFAMVAGNYTALLKSSMKLIESSLQDKGRIPIDPPTRALQPFLCMSAIKLPRISFPTLCCRGLF